MTPFTSLLGPRGWAIFLAIGIVLLIGVPILNLAVPPGSVISACFRDASPISYE